MKECNVCVAKCHPRDKVKMSNESCPKYISYKSSWSIRDLISKVSIKNRSNKVVNMLTKWM